MAYIKLTPNLSASMLAKPKSFLFFCDTPNPRRLSMYWSNHSHFIAASSASLLYIGGGGYARSLTACSDFYNSSSAFGFLSSGAHSSCPIYASRSSKNQFSCSKYRPPCPEGHFSCSDTQNSCSKNGFRSRDYGFSCSKNHFLSKKNGFLGQNHLFFITKPIFYVKQQIQGGNTHQCR